MVIYETKYRKENKLNEYVYTYTERSLELGYPCEVILSNNRSVLYENITKVNLYPIKVKDYDEFIKYSSYLIFGREHLQLNSNVSLLVGVIYYNANSKCKNITKVEDILEKVPYVLEEICELLYLVTHIKFEASLLNENYVFIGKDNNHHIVIDSDNFDIIRDVVMKMNLLKEPKYFEDKLYEQMYYKSIKANRKEGALLSDIIATVVQDMKYTFEFVANMPMFQLYVLYSRIIHVKTSDAITIYRTCSDKLPNISYTDGVVDNLFKEQDDSDLFADLGGIADKLT